MSDPRWGTLRPPAPRLDDDTVRAMERGLATAAAVLHRAALSAATPGGEQ